MSLPDVLGRGLTELGIDLSPGARQQLLDYLSLIEKWNRVYNLTAVREPEKMLPHHVLDSLAVTPHIKWDTIADVGSGAGLPGIPLAIARPQSRVTLVESNQKKSAFLKQAVIELGLGNITVAPVRAETWGGPDRFDCVISRAFSDVAEFVSIAAPLLRDGGTIAAMKGVYPYEELTQVPPAFRVREVLRLTVPGLDAERHLVLIDRIA